MKTGTAPPTAPRPTWRAAPAPPAPAWAPWTPPPAACGCCDRPARLEELELYLDGSTLEVFVNGGYATLTSRIFGAGDTLALDAFARQAEFCPMGEFVIADARENGV
ncbi:GH32 C-terminal domain-containing protein [uncultured Subdoligranulum sp.]|uniref:GH32 C-terminal domain-containing protein n=1 Tax=uncultured Subdoligranulum sp. TaxID=512298 RepID=UPI0025F40C83|nr:GH32 C-terminal domain-containing protein [uncultured Subdoligranulum sp.]